MKIFTFKLILFIAVASLCCSCGKKELDRQTAMRLLQGKTGDSIAAQFLDIHPLQALRDSPAPEDRALSAALQQLLNAGVLRVGPPEMQSWLTKFLPGPNGGWLTDDGANLRFVVGSSVPSEVTGITKTGDTTSSAQVRLHFTFAPMYTQYRALLDALHPICLQSDAPLSRTNLGDRMANANFQLFDDGWRLQGIQ